MRTALPPERQADQACAQHLGGHGGALELQGPHGQPVVARSGPALELEDLVVVHIAHDARPVDVEEHSDLLGDGGEDDLRSLPARDQGRHPAQCGLLLCEEPASLLGCFGAPL